jgi:hypothetical protein
MAFISAVNRWAQALLASSVLTKAVLLAKSVSKVIKKQLKSCFLKSLLAVIFKTKALKALLHLFLLFFFAEDYVLFILVLKVIITVFVCVKLCLVCFLKTLAFFWCVFL